MVHVAMAGSEGGVGLCMLLGGNRTPFCYIAQTPIIARRISLTTLRKEFDKNLVLRSCCSRFLQLLLAQIAQSGLCHRFHKTDQRLCRWLLVASDRLRATDLPVTQEALALMLGATRPNITTTLAVLRRGKLIECSRGRIILVERKHLESVACSCYSTAREYELGNRLTLDEEVVDDMGHKRIWIGVCVMAVMGAACTGAQQPALRNLHRPL